MKNRHLLAFLSGLISLFWACNPDCETYTSIVADIQPEYRSPGTQILITTSPINFLENRDVFIQKNELGERVLTTLTSEFFPEVGLRATLPMDISDTQTIFIEDDDCGGYIPLSNITIKSEAWFTSNLDYITPFPPQIIIPQVSITPPVNVVNAWFSPNDTRYCIWFAPELDSEGNEKATLIPGDPTLVPPDPEINRSSLELSAGCGTPTENDLFHNNPVSGIVDKARNLIQISIDRTSKGLGIEEYEGEFVDAEDLILPEYMVSSACSANDELKVNFMILRSKKTGQQLILFQN